MEIHNTLCFYHPNQVNIALTASLYMFYDIYDNLALALHSVTIILDM
jgi:hypothetical protein